MVGPCAPPCSRNYAGPASADHLAERIDCQRDSEKVDGQNLLGTRLRWGQASGVGELSHRSTRLCRVDKAGHRLR